VQEISQGKEKSQSNSRKESTSSSRVERRIAVQQDSDVSVYRIFHAVFGRNLRRCGNVLFRASIRLRQCFVFIPRCTLLSN